MNAEQLQPNNAKMKAAAQTYYELGANVLPIGLDKKPLCTWEKWIAERQTPEEFFGLPWNRANAFAVICGTKLNSGLFLAIIDYDVKNLPEEIVVKGKQALKAFPITQIEQTPSKGQHWIYYVHSRPKTNKSRHNESALELLAEKTYCIMAPSIGYQRLNDNGPTEVKDLEEVFNKALESIGGCSKETKTWFDRKETPRQQYRGKDPNCIRELAKGTKEGLRNEHGIRLASYYGNCKQHQTDLCLKLLKTWNKLNEPALENKELEALLRSALQGNYAYGCQDPILKEACEREGCPLAKKEAQEVTEQDKATASKLLVDPKLLDYALAIGKKCLIGEDNLLKQNIVYIVSGQTRYPISEIITGHSGSGKNESIRAVSTLFPEGWIFEFTASTPEAIKYIPEDFCGTIIVYELAGIRSETGTLGLRSIGEGRGIKTIYPMRDEATGKMTLGETQTNAKNFISTDSGLDIAADLYRRVFKNSMNDSLALTKRVCAKKMRDSGIPESLQAKLSPEQNKLPYSESDFRNAFALLNLKLEVVAYPPSNLLSLIDLANKKEQQVALRTQIERIVNVIRILALIHQKQRTMLTIEENSYILADVQDVELALTILETTIIETVTRIEKRQKDALEIIEKRNAPINKNQLADKQNCSTVTAARILKTLANNGYLKQNENVKPYSYELSDEEKTANPFVLSEKISEYKAVYPTELEKFLTRISSSCQTAIQRKISVEIPADLQEKYCIAIRQDDKAPITQELKPISETKPNLLVFSERISEISGQKENQ